MITFVAPAFNEEYDVYMFIGSLLCQKNPDWKVIIYHNGVNPGLKEIISGFRSTRILYKESEVNTGAWGCYNRIDALNNLVDTEYVIQTSIQDYWFPHAVDTIIKQSGNDFIYWNSVNHLTGYHQVLNSAPAVNHIDWGNFAVRTNIAKQVGIKHPKEGHADGLFVNDLMNSGLVHSQIKIEQVLTIHN